MEILVTGGAGFQGSHLTESLLANGHWVTVLDKSSRNAVRNMQGFRSHDRAAFISGSVTDGQTIDRAVRDHHVVFHLAAHVNVDQSLGDPESFLETNVMGTYRVLEAVRRYRNRLIYVSTCEVYGDGHNLKEGERLDEHAELKPNSLALPRRRPTACATRTFAPTDSTSRSSVRSTSSASAKRLGDSAR